MKRKKVWTEDDATCFQADHESIYDGYLKVTGERFNTGKAVSREDRCDCTIYNMPNGYRVVAAYPGNSYIEAPEEG